MGCRSGDTVGPAVRGLAASVSSPPGARLPAALLEKEAPALLEKEAPGAVRGTGDSVGEAAACRPHPSDTGGLREPPRRPRVPRGVISCCCLSRCRKVPGTPHAGEWAALRPKFAITISLPESDQLQLGLPLVLGRPANRPAFAALVILGTCLLLM